MAKNRYAMLTVDTEALPHRASEDHVNRLIWGKHISGTAGVQEMCAAGNEINAKHIFFIDFCGAYDRANEMRDVVAWLDRDGQDIQLHAHPEYLPPDFWLRNGFKEHPRYMNQFDYEKATFIIGHFAGQLSALTNKPVMGFRAGSFRWNADTIRALKEANIPVSFNNSMHASIVGQCIYSKPTNSPYLWSNGVIEVPMTERQFYPRLQKALWGLADFYVKHFKVREKYPDFGKQWWRRLQFPANYGNFPTQILMPYRSNSLLVLLMHSWSLLYWDKQGFGVYRDDRRIDGYRKLIRQLAKDFDIITTSEFINLYKDRKIQIANTTDLSLAELS